MSVEVLDQIHHLLPALSREEKMRLFAEIAEQVADGDSVPASGPLAGKWKDRVPADFDLEAALKEIRDQWTHEIEDIRHGRPPR